MKNLFKIHKKAVSQRTVTSLETFIHLEVTKNVFRPFCEVFHCCIAANVKLNGYTVRLCDCYKILS